MTLIMYSFRKKSKTEFPRKVRKCCFWGQKWPIYPTLGKTRIFCYFLVFTESWLYPKNQKKVMSQSWEKGVTDGDTDGHFWYKIKIFCLIWCPETKFLFFLGKIWWSEVSNTHWRSCHYPSLYSYRWKRSLSTDCYKGKAKTPKDTMICIYVVNT